MDLKPIIFIFCCLLTSRKTAGLGMNRVHPVDNVIRLQLLDFIQGGAGFADGLVLAGTIVEGGPVIGRRRKILGGKRIYPGLSGLPPYFRQNEQMDTCPSRTLGYRCLDWAPLECQVIRFLIYRSKLCTCKVNVC